MFKKIFFLIIIAIAVVAWFGFVKKPAVLNKFFPPKTASEPTVVSSTLGGQTNNLNPYEEAYTNPFE